MVVEPIEIAVVIVVIVVSVGLSVVVPSIFWL